MCNIGYKIKASMDALISINYECDAKYQFLR